MIQNSKTPDYSALMRSALLKLEKMRAKLNALERARSEPIAIVGLACRFPGGADDPDAFWELLRTGKDAVGEVPPSRWDVDAYYDPDLDGDDKMNTRWGGFLSDVDQFDRSFFNLSAREAAAMEPQQRLLLEVAWEALENANIPPDQLAGSQTGVFVGIINGDYYKLMLNPPTRAATGVSNSIAANRLSYFFDLQGPSMAIDTACSSSMVAIHLACQSLRSGESNLVLAGGVNLILSPDFTIAFSQAGMMASDGRCKTFDEAADGYVRGEGCGLVVLKRLSDALEDGDRIYALLRGSAVNQDGRSIALTAPNGLAQQAVVRQALKNAQLEPHKIDYIEAHGTGTSLGDAIEVRSLAAVLEGKEDRCALGSVKTNIGHSESAAGVAGFIKAVLSLQHGQIPPHPHLQTINPRLDLENTPFEIPTLSRPSSIKPRFIGVSSFGFGGTNAHAVLEAAAEGFNKNQGDSPIKRPSHLLALSAKSQPALRALASRYERHLATTPDLPDLCFTANTGRTHFEHRFAIVADDLATLRQQLGAFAAQKETIGFMSDQRSHHSRLKERPDNRRIAFLFTGQGSQYVGMGRQLYETQPTFRDALERCDELLRPLMAPSLLSLLYPASEDSPAEAIHDTVLAQPVLFAFEYALTELWRSWGIEPSAVIGHSVGEYVAACVAGVFTLEDGLRLVVERGQLMGELPRDGQMAVIFAEEAEVRQALAPYQESVSIAAINAPKQIVISGRKQMIDEVQEQLEKEFIMTRSLPVSHAFHSPLMEPMLDRFEQIVNKVGAVRESGAVREPPLLAAPRLPLISNLTGQFLSPEEIPDARYWRRHIRQTVQFKAGIQTLAAQGYDLFLEIGPTNTLSNMGKKCLPKGKGTWLSSLKKGQDDWQTLLNSLAKLYVAGVDVNWLGFDQDYPRHKITLPTYPWQRQRCWLKPYELKSL